MPRVLIPTRKKGLARPADSVRLVDPHPTGRFGTIRSYSGPDLGPNVRRILVFKGAELPVRFFHPDNWSHLDFVKRRGNSRDVRFISRLRNGESAGRTGIVAKKTERWFPANPSRLRAGHLFTHEWRNEPSMHVTDPRVLRLLSESEAKTLLTLDAAGVLAEKVQALVIHADGTASLVSRREPKAKGIQWKKFWLPNIFKLRRQVKAAGVRPGDVLPYNIIVNDQGRLCLIDASRVLSEPTRQRLVRALAPLAERAVAEGTATQRPLRPFLKRFFRWRA